MPKKVLLPLFTFLFIFAVPMLLAQEGQKNEQEKASAQAEESKKAEQRDRWEGVIVRSSPDKSNLTVREVGSTRTRTVRYDSSRRWVSQAHGSKEVNDIDAGQVKDGDRVICRGTWEKDGALHAAVISKRISHSPR